MCGLLEEGLGGMSVWLGVGSILFGGWKSAKIKDWSVEGSAGGRFEEQILCFRWGLLLPVTAGHGLAYPHACKENSYRVLLALLFDQTFVMKTTRIAQ